MIEPDLTGYPGRRVCQASTSVGLRCRHLQAASANAAKGSCRPAASFRSEDNSALFGSPRGVTQRLPHPLAHPTNSCRKHSGSRRYSRDPCCPAQPPPCAFAEHMAGMHGTKARKILLYWSNRPGPNLREKWLQTFAGKLACACVRAKSAIDVPTLASTGVAR